MPDNKHAVPLPRDADQVTFSELVPFRSKKIRLWRSPILYFVAITAVFNVLLFGIRVSIINGQGVDGQVSAFFLMVQITLFYMLFLAVLGVHAYARTDKPALYYLFPLVFVYLFMGSPLWHLVFVAFNAISQGDLMETSQSWPVRIYSAVTGPGLREELVKALPALIGAAITVRPQLFNWVPARLRELIRVRGPLDGVLMGFAAGASFLFAETGGQYVTNALVESMKASHGNLQGAFGSALMLLMPRVMNGWVGHMAWAGITGYAIGLAVLRPAQAWKIILGGWAVAATLHGLWDSEPPGGLAPLYLIGGAGGLLAISCLVKARQLEAAMFGRSTQTFGSIVVGSPAAAAYTPVPAPPPPAAMAPPQAARAPAAVSQAAASGAAASGGLTLMVGGVRLPLRDGAQLDLAREPALGGRGQGVVAAVTRHPTKPDVLGLKNVGVQAWNAVLRDGTVQPIDPQRSLRITPGVSIDFGGGLVGQVVTA